MKISKKGGGGSGEKKEGRDKNGRSCVLRSVAYAGAEGSKINIKKKKEQERRRGEMKIGGDVSCMYM